MIEPPFGAGGLSARNRALRFRLVKSGDEPARGAAPGKDPVLPSLFCGGNQAGIVSHRGIDSCMFDKWIRRPRLQLAALDFLPELSVYAPKKRAVYSEMLPCHVSLLASELVSQIAGAVVQP